MGQMLPKRRKSGIIHPFPVIFAELSFAFKTSERKSCVRERESEKKETKLR